MRALLDMTVSPTLSDTLAKFGHEGIHAYSAGMGRATDTQLLAAARHEERIIITVDLDFPRLLAISSEAGPGIILFRGSNYSDEEMRDLLSRVLSQVDPSVIQTSICVVDKRHLRIARLPIRRKSK